MYSKNTMIFIKIKIELKITFICFNKYCNKHKIKRIKLN